MNYFGKVSERFRAWLSAYKKGYNFFAASQADRLGVLRSELVTRPVIDENIELFVNPLEARINTSLIPKLERVVHFIQQHDKEFIIPNSNIRVSNTTTLLPEIQDMISKLGKELSSEFQQEFGIDVQKIMQG